MSKVIERGLFMNVLINEDITLLSQKLSKLYGLEVNMYNMFGKNIGSSNPDRVGVTYDCVMKVISRDSKSHTIISIDDRNNLEVLFTIISRGRAIGAGGFRGNIEKIESNIEILKMTFESIFNRKLDEAKIESLIKYEKELVLDILYGLKCFDNISKRLNTIGFNICTHNLLIKVYDTKSECCSLLEDVNYTVAKLEDSNIYIVSDFDLNKVNQIRDIVAGMNKKIIISEIVEFDNIASEFRIMNYISNCIEVEDKVNYTSEAKVSAFLDSIDYSKYDFLEAKEIIKHQYLVDTFLAYVENNLSLTKTSEKLYIHTNTLKYRIKKVEELTGCSLHNIDDLIKIKLSILSLNKQSSK